MLDYFLLTNTSRRLFGYVCKECIVKPVCTKDCKEIAQEVVKYYKLNDKQRKLLYGELFEEDKS